MCMATGGGGGGEGGNAGTDAASGAMSGASMGAEAGPWGAAIGAVGGATMAIIGGNGARQLKKGQENQKRIEQERLIAENRKRATTDYLRNVQLEQLKASQEKDALAEKSQDISRQTDSSAGTALASAAERGVAGRSVDQIVQDFHFQESTEVGRLRANQGMADQQHQANLTGLETQFDSRVASVKPYTPATQAPVDYFSPIFGVLKTGGETMMATKAGKGK